jgi:DNA-binding NtrC family response regulator
LREYAWPGNVLQVQRVIEGLTILAERIDGEAVRLALRRIEANREPLTGLTTAAGNAGMAAPVSGGDRI